MARHPYENIPTKVDIYISALRQIYSAAEGLERGEENIVECAQAIQRLCDDALRGLPLQDVFKEKHV